MSSPEIGKIFQRDHATILNAESKIDDRLKNDPQVEFEINNLIKSIKNIK
jgi:chromosomal replication initiation ATPase DnaA